MKPSPLHTIALVLALPALNCSKPSIDPIFEGCATDEHQTTLDDYESTDRVKTDGKAGPKWLQPAQGSAALSFPSTVPTMFSWQPTANDPGSSQGNVTCAPALLPTRSASSLWPLHEAPVSGVIYDLQFSIGASLTYRVLTTHQNATVPAAVWSGWAGKSVVVDLVSAKLLNNEVAEGPYRPAAMLTFQVKP